MFDWFWEFLYGISKSIFRLIDGLMSCANKLCGIDPITVDGEEVSLINYFLSHERVALAFKASALIGIILVGVFALFAILRSIVSEKSNTTPVKVFIQAMKTVFMYLMIPACMVTVIYFVNIFMNSLYAATLGGSNDGLGRFLCGAFSQDALVGGTESDFYLDPSFDYMDTDALWHYIDLSDFDFFFSWIAGFCILISLAQALLMFVDRAISIVILFIVSPISLSTNVIDDGAHFKLWRDQILVKFLTGYGCILGINVYALLITIISDSSVVFFEDSSFLNFLLKIAFMVGGAVSMQRIMALIGNLVSAGAGSNELRDNAIASAGFAHVAGKAFGALKSIAKSPFTATRSAYNFAQDTKQYGAGGAIGSRLGFRTDKDYGGRSKLQESIDKERFGRNGLNGGGGAGGTGDNKVADAITGNKKDNPGEQSSGDTNKNPSSGNQNGNTMLNNVISGMPKAGGNSDDNKK